MKKPVPRRRPRAAGQASPARRPSAVAAEPGSARLDLRLIALHPGTARRRAQDAILKGQVDVDGVARFEPGLIVPPAAEVRWHPNRPARKHVRTPLDILFEDRDLLVVEKPAGLLSVPTSGECDEESLSEQVAEYVRVRWGRQGHVGVVHRLDRNTSGILVFAISHRVEEPLRQLFIDHAIERQYDALVVPPPAEDSGRVDRYVSRELLGGRRHLVADEAEGRRAITFWRVLRRAPRAAWLECRLETGRQHQIRLHLASIGSPVVGDNIYGESAPTRGVPRQMLHARRLGFRHPATGATLSFERAPPPDFQTAWRRLAQS